MANVLGLNSLSFYYNKKEVEQRDTYSNDLIESNASRESPLFFGEVRGIP